MQDCAGSPDKDVHRRPDTMVMGVREEHESARILIQSIGVWPIIEGIGRICVPRLVARHRVGCEHDVSLANSSKRNSNVAAEEAVWSGSPSQVINAGKFILCALATLTGVFAIVAIPYAIWIWLVVKNTRYELTTQRLKLHSGVLNKITEELELYRVTDSRFEQPFFLRLFSLGNVVLISSDDTTPTTRLRAIAEGGPLREKIRTLVEARRDQKRVRVAEFE